MSAPFRTVRRSVLVVEELAAEPKSQKLQTLYPMNSDTF